MSKSLRYELCRILWPDVYTDELTEDEVEGYSVGWKDPDDNDIIEAVSGLIVCRDRFKLVTGFIAKTTEGLKDDVAGIIEDIEDRGVFMPGVGAKK